MSDKRRENTKEVFDETFRKNPELLLKLCYSPCNSITAKPWMRGTKVCGVLEYELDIYVSVLTILILWCQSNADPSSQWDVN